MAQTRAGAAAVHASSAIPRTQSARYQPPFSSYLQDILPLPLPFRSQVLQDPSLLFWNRAGRANKLFKAAEYEPACESYQLAHAEMERMAATTAPPQPDVVATFHFNFARSCQLLGRVVRAIELYDSVLASSPKHARALWRRAECHLSVCNYSAAIGAPRWEEGGRGEEGMKGRVVYCVAAGP